MNWNFLLGFAPRVIALVENIQTIFKSDSGAVKKQAALEALTDGEVLIEGLAGRDLLKGAEAQVLLDEGIEVGVQIMKLQERLRDIAKRLTQLGVAAPSAPAE